MSSPDESASAAELGDTESSTQNSRKTMCVGILMTPSEKDGKAQVNAKSINIKARSVAGYDFIGFSSEGEGHTNIKTKSISARLGNGTGNGGNLNGERVTAFQTGGRNNATLTTLEFTSKVNPGPGETLAVLRAIDDSTLIIDADENHQLGNNN